MRLSVFVNRCAENSQIVVKRSHPWRRACNLWAALSWRPRLRLRRNFPSQSGPQCRGGRLASKLRIEHECFSAFAREWPARDVRARTAIVSAGAPRQLRSNPAVIDYGRPFKIWCKPRATTSGALGLLDSVNRSRAPFLVPLQHPNFIQRRQRRAGPCWSSDPRRRLARDVSRKVFETLWR